MLKNSLKRKKKKPRQDSNPWSHFSESVHAEFSSLGNLFLCILHNACNYTPLKVLVLMFKVNGSMVDLRKSKMQNDGEKEKFERFGFTLQFKLEDPNSFFWILFSGLDFLNKLWRVFVFSVYRWKSSLNPAELGFTDSLPTLTDFLSLTSLPPGFPEESVT